MNQVLHDKYDRLSRRLRSLRSVVVAYSGGVDSTYLAAAAHDELGPAAVMVTARSPSVATRALERAKQVAAEQRWDHTVVDTLEIHNESYATNGSDRCYWCKSELLDVLGPIARERDATVIVGTNADDLGDHRPGISAATERGALAPLAEAGMTKADIRVLSRARGLPTWDRPASPCLASRFAYGVRVTEEGLRRVEIAEEKLHDLGFEVVRVRDHGNDLARIEVPPSELGAVVRESEAIAGELRAAGFRYVSLDLQGFRSGSLNEVLAAPTLVPRAAD